MGMGQVLNNIKAQMHKSICILLLNKSCQPTDFGSWTLTKYFLRIYGVEVKGQTLYPLITTICVYYASVWYDSEHVRVGMRVEIVYILRKNNNWLCRTIIVQLIHCEVCTSSKMFV